MDVGSHIQTIFVFSFYLLPLSHYILVVLSNFDMVSEPPLGCWADLPPYYGSRVWLVRHTWGGILKWESCPTLTKYSWVVQFISHGHPSSLKASFEIELGPLDFNMALEHGLILEDIIAVFVLPVSVRSYLGCFNLLWAYSAVDRRMHDICQFSFGHQFNHSSARIASSCLLV